MTLVMPYGARLFLGETTTGKLLTYAIMLQVPR
jgi:hypothetical protein